MDDMREIVTVEQVNRLFLLLAVAGPILGGCVGAAIGARKGFLRLGAIKGLIIGLVGPLNLILWKLYNAITDRLGLDSVKNLLIQMGLFILLGVAAGLLIGRFWRRNGFASEGPETEDPSLAGVGGPSRRGGSEARRFEDSDTPPREP